MLWQMQSFGAGLRQFSTFQLRRAGVTAQEAPCSSKLDCLPKAPSPSRTTASDTTGSRPDRSGSTAHAANQEGESNVVVLARANDGDGGNPVPQKGISEVLPCSVQLRNEHDWPSPANSDYPLTLSKTSSVTLDSSRDCR
jgi:hypothetical protein